MHACVSSCDLAFQVAVDKDVAVHSRNWDKLQIQRLSSSIDEVHKASNTVAHVMVTYHHGKNMIKAVRKAQTSAIEAEQDKDVVDSKASEFNRLLSGGAQACHMVKLLQEVDSYSLGKPWLEEKLKSHDFIKHSADLAFKSWTEAFSKCVIEAGRAISVSDCRYHVQAFVLHFGGLAAFQALPDADCCKDLALEAACLTTDIKEMADTNPANCSKEQSLELYAKVHVALFTVECCYREEEELVLQPTDLKVMQCMEKNESLEILLSPSSSASDKLKVLGNITDLNLKACTDDFQSIIDSFCTQWMEDLESLGKAVASWMPGGWQAKKDSILEDMEVLFFLMMMFHDDAFDAVFFLGG